MDLFTFLLAVLLLELTPGPNMAYLATLALSRGRAAGLIATAGVACRTCRPCNGGWTWSGSAHPAVPAALRCTPLDWGRVSTVFGVGGLADRKASFAGARISCHHGGSTVPSRLPLERLQSEIHPILRIGASHLHRNWAQRSVTSDPDGRVWKPLCRDRHRRACEHCGPCCAIAALVGGRAAATDRTPYVVRPTRLGRGLASVDDAAVAERSRRYQFSSWNLDLPGENDTKRRLADWFSGRCPSERDKLVEGPNPADTLWLICAARGTARCFIRIAFV